MPIEPVLHRRVARVAARPVSGYPLLQPGGFAAVGHAQHQVGTQAVEQALTVAQVATNLPFELFGHPWQQLGVQVLFVGTAKQRIALLALVQAQALMQ